MFQRLLALSLLLLLSPLLLILWGTLSVTSSSGALFKQDRVGFKQQTFTIFKFTTMQNGKITFLGHYLRKTGLDELPQFYNIFKGEMSFIGPRPLTAADVKRLKWEKITERWLVKPGISGLAQLSRVCTAADSIKNDLYYVKNKSIKLDLKILLQSILIPVLGKPKMIPHNE